MGGKFKQMNTILWTAVMAFIFAIPLIAVDKYTVDPVHSVVGFSVRHFGIGKVKGNFNEFSGNVVWDDKNLSSSSIKGIVKVASIDTQNQKRDDDLKSPNFFDSEKFPEIRFESKKISKNSSGLAVVGNLTIKNTTKEISVPLEATDAIVDPWGKTRRAFSAELKINRNDYGISFNHKIQNGSFIVSEEIGINLEMEVIKE